MVDIAGAAAGPQLYARPDPLTNGAQASQVATDNVSPDQAAGVTAPGNADADGEGAGNQGDFENPASGGNIVQAQLAGSDDPDAELAGVERPLSPIEEALRDFPPDAVVQREEGLAEAGGEAVAGVTGDGQPTTQASGNEAGAVEGTSDFGVTETASQEQAQAVAREQETQRAADEENAREDPEPRTDLSGATDDPFNIANGSAASQSGTGNPAAQPPGSAVDIAA